MKRDMVRYRAYSPILKRLIYITDDFGEEYIIVNIRKSKKCFIFETMETLDVQYKVNVKDIKGNDIFEKDTILIDNEKHYLYYDESRFTMIVKNLNSGKESYFWDHLSKKLETLGYIV